MASKSLENIVVEFEHSISHTDTKLDRLAWKLDNFELSNARLVADEASQVSNEEDINNETSEQEMDLLRELLMELDKLKKNHASLRSELQQVHTMHADLTQALRQKVDHVQDVFRHLRIRFAEHYKNGITH